MHVGFLPGNEAAGCASRAGRALSAEFDLEPGGPSRASGSIPSNEVGKAVVRTGLGRVAETFIHHPAAVLLCKALALVDRTKTQPSHDSRVCRINGDRNDRLNPVATLACRESEPRVGPALGEAGCRSFVAPKSVSASSPSGSLAHEQSPAGTSTQRIS